MSEYRKVAYKPGDEENTRIVLRSDGKLFVYGDVIDPEVNLEWNKGSYRDVARDLVVVDWDTPSGYILSGWGTVHTFGVATPVPGGASPGAPTSTKGFDLYRAIVMDPAGTGQGYRLRADGLVERFGSVLPANVGTGPGANAIKNGAAIDMVMETDAWGSDMRFYVLDQYGKVWPCNGAHSVRKYTGETTGWNAFLYMRAIDVADWDDGIGYVTDVYGRVFSFTSPDPDVFAKKPASKPNWRAQGWAIVRDIHIVDYSPFHYKIFTNAGAISDIWVTDPPVIFFDGVDAEVTDTRRPTISWTWEDQDNDKPSKYEVAIYNRDDVFGHPEFEAFVGPADPVQSIVIDDYRITAWRPEEDLVNGEYTAFIRATESDSELLSGLDAIEWTQNVVMPDAPIFTVTPEAGLVDRFNISLEDEELFETPLVTVQVLTEQGWVDALHGRRAELSGSPLALVERYWEPPQVVEVSYRARVYESDDPSIYTEWAYEGGGGTQTNRTWVSIPSVNGSAKEIRIASEAETLPVVAGIFQPIGEKMAVSVMDENPVKGRSGTMTLQVLDPLAAENFENLFLAGEVLLLRDQFGRAMYFSLKESASSSRLKAVRLPYETTTVRDAKEWQLTYNEVVRPT